MAPSLDEAIAEYEKGARDAAKTIATTLAERERDPGAFNLLAVIAQDEGAPAIGETLARDALTKAPGHPIYLNTLGNCLLNQGRTPEAIDAFAEAHAALPDQPDILFNLANAERQIGDLTRAAATYRRVIALKPSHVGAANNLGIALKALGDPDGASSVLLAALAHAPNSAELRFNLANAFHASGRLEAAEASYRGALALDPHYAEAWANLGVVLAEGGQKDAARDCFQKAIAFDKTLVPAYVGLANLVDDGAMDAIAHRRAVLALNPDLAAVHSSLLMCMHYGVCSRAELFAEHKAFGARHDRPNARAFSAEHDFAPERRLHVGIVSGDFRFHAMAFLVRPILEACPRDAFELYGYSNTARPDQDTPRFQAAFEQWRDVRSLPTDDLTALIARDGIDILVDLSGHAPHNRLPVFAARPAPVQVAWGDYVDTRGLTAIDYLLGDPIHTPSEDDAFYIEKVERLSRDYVCYRPPDYAPPIAVAPSLANRFVTFGTFSEATKIGAEAIAQWAAVLRAVPGARFLFNGHTFNDGARRGRLVSMFLDEGISGERVIFRGGGRHPDFLAQYSLVDIILDTAPYSGGLTTCEALLMGVPVVTLAGDRFCGRHAQAHLVHGGFPEGIAHTREEFVAKATALAAEPQALNARRKSIREAFLASPLCDVAARAEDFYGTLRRLWRKRCA